jgi:hypothetical protein
MQPLHLAHLILISMWGGVVAAELILEVASRDADTARFAAEVHYYIDLLVEGPLLLGVLGTGGILLWRAWPPSTLHVVKVAAALAALAVNGWCVVMVIARKRRVADPAAVEHYRRRVFWAGVGVPFAAVAAYIGFVYFT